MEHNNCNCEDCWWARGQQEVCPTCGCVGEDCPTHEDDGQPDEAQEWHDFDPDC